MLHAYRQNTNRTPVLNIKWVFFLKIGVTLAFFKVDENFFSMIIHQLE